MHHSTCNTRHASPTHTHTHAHTHAHTHTHTHTKGKQRWLFCWANAAILVSRPISIRCLFSGTTSNAIIDEGALSGDARNAAYEDRRHACAPRCLQCEVRAAYRRNPDVHFR